MLYSRLQIQTLALASVPEKSTDPDYRPPRRVILTLGTVWNFFSFAKSASLVNILFNVTGDHPLDRYHRFQGGIRHVLDYSGDNGGLSIFGHQYGRREQQQQQQW